MIERKYTGVASKGADVVANPSLDGSEQALNSIRINGENFKIEGGGSDIETLYAVESFEYPEDGIIEIHFSNSYNTIDCSKEMVFSFYSRTQKNIIYKVYFSLDRQISGTQTINNVEFPFDIFNYQSGELVWGLSFYNNDACIISLVKNTLIEILGDLDIAIEDAKLIGHKPNELTNPFYGHEL